MRRTDEVCVFKYSDDFMQFVCDGFSSSESETEMRLSTAQNLLMMFRPRSKSEQDKVRLLSNLCRIYSKETKQVERAVLELTDMMSENVRLDLISRVIDTLVLLVS